MDIDENTYNEELIEKVKEELFGYGEEKIDLCLKKVPDVFNLVIKERVALFNANR